MKKKQLQNLSTWVEETKDKKRFHAKSEVTKYWLTPQVVLSIYATSNNNQPGKILAMVVT